MGEVERRRSWGRALREGRGVKEKWRYGRWGLEKIEVWMGQ